MFEESIINSDKKDEVKEKQNDELLDKMAELEDRNRRNNLRFSGIEEEPNETWEQSEEKVKQLLKDKLEIEGVKIERAHRSGIERYENDERNTKRTIIVKFLNYKEKQKIIDAFHKKKLWEKKIYVNEDFSKRTVEKRRELFRKAKDLREKGTKVKVVYTKLVYSDRILNSNLTSGTEAIKV